MRYEYIKASTYAAVFEAVYGKDVWKDADKTFNSIADVIVAYEYRQVLRC